MKQSAKHWQRPKQYIIPLRFIKGELLFTIDSQIIERAKTIGQFLGIIIFTGFITYTILGNIAPFGITTTYTLSQNQPYISVPGPQQRVKISESNGETTFHQKNDLVYFTTSMPFQFDSATVRVTYQNPDPEQIIQIGFQDNEQWHYTLMPLDLPFINSLTWKRQGTHPTLYERESHFRSTADFLKHPVNALIGTIGKDIWLSDFSETELSNYHPQTKETVIAVPLRGKHIFYAYLADEPFHLTIQKQDLNWYKDPDVMVVKIYKDEDLVYQATADDDGIQDSSGRSLPPQELVIKNPGPGLPEKGVYKIVIEANGDTVIKRISTNLHKIIFQGSLFPAANREQYHTLIASTSATIVYTNALALSAISYHNAGLQDILVDDQLLRVNILKDNQIITPDADLAKVIIPKNDIVLSAYQGYFSFEPDQFFLLSPLHITPITKPEDIQMLDYIVGDYTPPQKEGEWQANTLRFDIRRAFIKDGKLNWIISAPKLQDNQREVIIKDIEITFEKKGWL